MRDWYDRVICSFVAMHLRSGFALAYTRATEHVWNLHGVQMNQSVVTSARAVALEWKMKHICRFAAMHFWSGFAISYTCGTVHVWNFHGVQTNQSVVTSTELWPRNEELNMFVGTLAVRSANTWMHCACTCRVFVRFREDCFLHLMTPAWMFWHAGARVHPYAAGTSSKGLVGWVVGDGCMCQVPALKKCLASCNQSL